MCSTRSWRAAASTHVLSLGARTVLRVSYRNSMPLSPCAYFASTTPTTKSSTTVADDVGTVDASSYGVSIGTQVTIYSRMVLKAPAGLTWPARRHGRYFGTEMEGVPSQARDIRALLSFPTGVCCRLLVSMMMTAQCARAHSQPMPATAASTWIRGTVFSVLAVPAECFGQRW